MATASHSNAPLLTGLGIALILASGGLSQLYLIPNLRAANADLNQAQLQLTETKKNISTIDKIDADLTVAVANMQARGIQTSNLPFIIPPTEDIPSLYVQMETLTSFKGVSGITYQIGIPSDDAKANKVQGAIVPVSVSGTGSYSDLKAYITHLQNNIRPIVITDIDFTSQSSKDSSNKTAPAPSGILNLAVKGYVTATALSPAYASSKKGGNAGGSAQALPASAQSATNP